MWRKRLKNLFWISLLIIAVGLQVWEENQKTPKSPSSPSKSSSPATTPAATPPPAPARAESKSKSKSKSSTAPPSPSAPATQRSANGFEILSGARLLDDRNNDGDSFKISHAGETYEIRLYFVDAPEKRLHQYNGERIDHQSRYFGSPNREATMQIGLRAKDLVQQLLSSQPFRVATRWEEVFDSGRHYAFVFLEDSGEELSEILVREGLARIYTQGSHLPDGRKENDFERHLKKLEASAKSQRKGGWALAKSPLTR
jgi:endonuclease YncB( thermonuclease family)